MLRQIELRITASSGCEEKLIASRPGPEGPGTDAAKEILIASRRGALV
jgi:hypothetical protein